MGLFFVCNIQIISTKYTILVIVKRVTFSCDDHIKEERRSLLSFL